MSIYIFPGATSVIAQFHDVGPYRWPGWFITAQGLALATVLILFFTEARQCCKGSPKCCYSSALARWKLSIKLNSRLKWTKYLSVSSLSIIFCMDTKGTIQRLCAIDST